MNKATQRPRRTKAPPRKWEYKPMRAQAPKPMSAEERAAWADYADDRSSLNEWRSQV